MRKYWKGIGLVLVAVIGLFTLTACENEVIETQRNGIDYLVLVNKYSQLPEDWEKNLKLVDAKNAWDEDIQVEKEAYEHYQELVKDVNNALKDLNATIELDSTYRSVQAQQDLWDEWTADPEKGLEYVKKYVAVPGYSEHHTGLAIDICLTKNGELVYDNDEMKAEKEIFKIVHSKLAKYGFIVRYPEGREDSTGYTYEPWHLRYVGSEKIAQTIVDNKWTFEEYLDQLTDYVNYPEAAKYHIEQALMKDFKNKTYKGKIENVRFNVKKIYTYKDADDNETIKSLNLGKNDLAFEVEYQLQPKDESNIEELTLTDGEYDKDLGWVKGINRLGIAKQDPSTKVITIENLGTGW